MKYITRILLFVLLFCTAQTYANLLISPTRVVFDERQRSAKVFLINSSQEYKTYRLSFKEKMALPEGGYTDVSEQENPMRLSGLLRMTPKQVRLAPGERQVVKLALRRQRNMAAGEYRSHLFFQALPEKQDLDNEGVGIRLNMIMSYSIPLIYRQSASSPQVTIDEATLSRGKSGRIETVNLSLSRAGDASPFGRISVFWRKQKGASWKEAALVNSYSIYPELSQAQLQLTLLDGDLFQGARSGELKVVYTGSGEYKGQSFAERIFSVTVP
ncbi:fimbria/pilus periplasmic chaperone [Pseudoalteromonas sp. DL2-H2.2]|uniref:fimbrial biogenesis chaperone n=1 Tax=Pseudoalteromonas sp. DL2-H2.2 TaxID=2908889 RepID=UPI001F162A70|nr:fimbria/pilus periplasmic chaperone [Pseudoalteromonas sp. DL2-H2.2]MCF2907251.1 fimbria/pilus periplasmic chaperone [Pseudoalteromonas sp. DL2-H2.2]